MIKKFHEFIYFTSITIVGRLGSSSIEEITFPNSVVSVEAYGLSSTNLRIININDGCRELGANWILSTKVTELILPTTITYIGNMATRGPAYVVVCLAEDPPTLNSITGTYSYVYVPDSSVDAYKAASNWANIASKIRPLSEYIG